MDWFAQNIGDIVTIISLILNLLGGTGIVKPVVDIRKKDSTNGS